MCCEEDRYVPTGRQMEQSAIAQSDYPAGMRDAQFPYYKAKEAMEACCRVVAMLRDDLDVRADWVADIERDWEGVYRDEFDETWAGKGGQEPGLVKLKDNLNALAHDIGDAWDAAEAHNGRQAERRAEHDEEEGN